MESLKIFVTGAGGFMGSHLVDFLADRGHKIFGTYFGSVNLIEEIRNKSNLSQCDMRHFGALKKLIAEIKPDQVYHLAAQSYPTKSWEDPWYTVETNVLGTINIFEAVKELKLKCRTLVAGSSAQYGFVDSKDVPIKETQIMKPLHPYGVSKVAQEGLTHQYYKNFGVDGFTMRIFNTTGPRKVGDVCADFTKQLAAIELGKQAPKIRVGNLSTRRAITDVRDEIRGFVLAMEKAKAGEAYNISGSKAYLIKDILDIGMGFCSAKPEVFVDPTLLRTTDEPIIFGDSTKLHEATGWQQEIPIEKTVKDMIDYWKVKLK
jgi:GDP-4-dehydro-6-deoxy-D-mannose reductase